MAAGTVASASTNVGSAVTGSFGSINIAVDGSYTYTVDNSHAAVQALRTSSNTLTDVFTYTMRDTAGLTSTTQITVTIQGANDAPTDITGTLSIAENSANSTLVGTVATTDIDTGDTFTYSLTNNAGGRFAINSSTGQVTVASNTLLDRELGDQAIVVRTTDAGGLTFDKTMTVSITNVNEAPSNILLSQYTGTTNISDDFNDGVIDSSKWTTNTSSAAGGAAVAETGGQIVLTQRGYINTASAIDPAAANGVRITGSATFSSATDFLRIVTRSSGTPSGAFGEVSEGIVFTIGPAFNQLYIQGFNASVSSSTTANFSFATNTVYNFEVIDTAHRFRLKSLTRRALAIQPP